MQLDRDSSPACSFYHKNVSIFMPLFALDFAIAACRSATRCVSRSIIRRCITRTAATSCSGTFSCP